MHGVLNFVKYMLTNAFLAISLRKFFKNFEFFSQKIWTNCFSSKLVKNFNAWFAKSFKNMFKKHFSNFLKKKIEISRKFSQKPTTNNVFGQSAQKSINEFMQRFGMLACSDFLYITQSNGNYHDIFIFEHFSICYFVFPSRIREEKNEIYKI